MARGGGRLKYADELIEEKAFYENLLVTSLYSFYISLVLPRCEGGGGGGGLKYADELIMGKTANKI